MRQTVFQKLLKNGLTIGFAESMTGGFSAFQIIKHPGASKVIKGSVIAYSDLEKVRLLGINPILIESLSSISEEVALAMAKSIRHMLNADIGVGITGNAGPTFQEGSDRQEAHIGIVFRDRTLHRHLSLEGFTRMESIRETTRIAYTMIDALLSEFSR